MHSETTPKSSMGMLRRFAVAVALGLLAFAGTAVRATVVPLTMEEMMAISDEVVTVRVTETTPEFANGIIITKAKFTVLENFKGAMQGEQELDVLGGVYKGIAMKPGGVPSLEKGEEAVLFLSNPYKRLSAAQKAQFHNSSPLVNKLNFVGGWQGKLNIVPGEGDSAAKSAAPIKATAKVTRVTASSSLEPIASVAPQYGQLSGALKTLATAQKQKISQKAATTSIAGINGKFVIPDRSADVAIRAFDPLPSMAYMSDKELDALEKQVHEKTATKNAAPTTGAKAPGEE